jgi:uncharacterized protein YndB with AHSA1/START domain
MPATENQTELRLTHRFEAPRERVFDAWTDPELLRRWWAAAPDWDTPSAEVDLRPGGRYRLSMRNPETGDVHTVGGEYTEVSRPERLVYTWAWEGEDANREETVVTVEFADRGGDATEVVLTHAGFASDESRTNHEHGWRGCLANLESRVFPPAQA